MADQDGSDASPAKSQGSDSLPRSEEKRPVSASSWPSSSASTLGHAPTSPSSSPTLTASPTLTITSQAPPRPEMLVHRIDERQRLARERREEMERQAALREAQWQAREERARQYYERQLEERRRRLEEQRLREEKRREAVEEKRRQKQEEEKARHEAVMRRTIERSQRSRQKPNRWSWGGATPANTPTTPGDAERRSVSTMNLSRNADPVMTKRLSSSSATLPHSPDRGLRRMTLSPWENTVVSRLQQPTHAYLARSRSAMSLSGEPVLHVCPRSASCHPGGPTSFKSLQAPAPRSQERAVPRDPRRRTTGACPSDGVRKSWSNLSLPLAPTITLTPKKRTQSPGNQRSKVTAPSPGRPPQKAPVRPLTPLGRPPTPKSPGVGDDTGNLRPLRALPDLLDQDRATPERTGDGEAPVSPAPGPAQPRPQTLGQTKTGAEPPSAASAPRPSAGTTDPEEASRILAEKRRQAREQREREEEQRRLQEEAQRMAQEEIARRQMEERARREEEAQRQEEERRRREEEERRAEEERAQQEREETERLQKQREEESRQREEAESRQREEAERQRQEREKRFQREEAERLERKKRLEEIMKRTRRSDTAEKKTTPHKNIDGEASGPMSSGPLVVGSVSGAQHSDRNGHPSPQPALVLSSAATLPSADSRENGEFEEVVELPEDSRLSRPDGEEAGEEDARRVSVVAFRESYTLKPLTGAEDSSTQQRADVV